MPHPSTHGRARREIRASRRVRMAGCTAAGRPATLSANRAALPGGAFALPLPLVVAQLDVGRDPRGRRRPARRRARAGRRRHRAARGTPRVAMNPAPVWYLEPTDTQTDSRYEGRRPGGKPLPGLVIVFSG